ncbi:hypothetical protein [Congregibacter litoralis]|uniref:Uncharacterized protein n=1 Tax=Congregibacter litoralis KT71 TaxID=314285 RepID=A4A3A7_9GAMM|nr:hypothetical protein [Congregibacter litoralis]EAQ99180.1 hypothetical protein KT71_15961 [Congregibacter litoralis KT71]
MNEENQIEDNFKEKDYLLNDLSDGAREVSDEVIVFPTPSIAKIMVNGVALGSVPYDTAEHKAIVQGIGAYLCSSKYRGLAEKSKATKNFALSKFLEYLSEMPTVPYTLLGDIEKRDVERGLKPQASSVRFVTTVFAHIIKQSMVSGKTLLIVRNIYNSRNLTKKSAWQVESRSLGSWFAQVGWIREVMGDAYIALASPKRLMKSFLLAYSNLADVLLEARDELLRRPTLLSAYSAMVLVESDVGNRKANGRKLFSELMSSLQVGPPSRNMWLLQQVMIAEIIAPKHLEKLPEESLKCLSGSDAGSSIDKFMKNHWYATRDEALGKQQLTVFMRPHALTPDISALIELLVYHLVVAQTVQPSDAINLKSSNFVITKKPNGRVRSLQIVYFKGRSNKKYETPLLNASDPVARVFLRYLKAVEDRGFRWIFSAIRDEAASKNGVIEVVRFRFRNPYITHSYSGAARSFTQFLTNPIIREILRSSLPTGGHVFVDAINAMCGPDTQEWSSKSGIGHPVFRQAASKPLPQFIYGPSLIKNSAVHARTDAYRDEDLIDANSHSSQTEKLSYLTDDNKDWVNQVGRITRLVIDDITNVLGQRYLYDIDLDAREKILATKVMSTTNSTDLRLRSELLSPLLMDDDSGDERIVYDSVNTAVTMFHYLAEADRNADALKRRNLAFFCETVVVNVEWIHHCLSVFSRKNIAVASDKYQKIKSVLPPLFVDEIANGLTAYD